MENTNTVQNPTTPLQRVNPIQFVVYTITEIRKNES